MRPWTGYYCRWNPRMRPQDCTKQRNTQVLAINGELKSKFEALKKDLVGKRKNKHDTLDPGGPENNGSSGGVGGSDHAHALHTRFESVNI